LKNNLIVEKANIILCFDFHARKWMKAQIIRIEKDYVTLKGIEGSLIDLEWKEDYDSLKDPELYKPA